MKQTKKTIMVFLLSALSASLAAAPDGYSVNSDSQTSNSDSLYRIDLASGQSTRLGAVMSLGNKRLDVEGLAFAPDGTLYGIDDESLKLFPLNIDNGQVISASEKTITGLTGPSGNDFGMTFGCDGNLYVTSAKDADDSLYRLSLDGTATRIGAVGSLGTDIHALAAWGNPVQLYGLSAGGLNGGGQASLYSINITNGTKTLIGPLTGGFEKFDQSGMSFDNSGQLWAITDRGQALPQLPSQLLQVNKANGAATVVSSTAEFGFESLAISVPRGCDGGGGGGDKATFTVQSRFVDGNNLTPITLHLSCNTGVILDQTKTVQPNEGLFGAFEVAFIVSGLGNTPLSCTVMQDAPFGYTPSYTCLGVSDCAEAQSTSSCSFSNVAAGSDNLCQVQSYPNAVPFTVSKQWLIPADQVGETDFADIRLECENVYGGDGQTSNGRMYWSWKTSGNAQRTANIQPDFKGKTQCRAEEGNIISSVEATNGCESWIPVDIGDTARACTITNTVFLEGIPTLSDYGRLLLALLMLGVGLVAVRRS